MAKVGKTYKDLMALAKRYGVDDNALFVAAAEQYDVQRRVIQDIKAVLEQDDGLLTSKEYVKGRENVYANPLVKELPKYTDSANKTLTTMLNIIEKLGKEQQTANPLAVQYE